MDNMLTSSLEENIRIIKEVFRNDNTLKVREFQGNDAKFPAWTIIYIDGMIDTAMVNDNVVTPILDYKATSPQLEADQFIEMLQNSVIEAVDIKKVDKTTDIVPAIIAGNTLLLTESSTEGIVIGSQGWSTRSISEPETEKTLNGPREGFTESLLVNLSLIRRKIQEPNLKFVYKELGLRSRTKLTVCYLEGIASEEILGELYKRLEQIEIDAILDSGYVAELISDGPYSPFTQIGSTERPDAVAGKILEGRIAVIFDGTPVVLTVPYIFLESFQTSEDYYISFFMATVNRILRLISFFLTISIPAVYVSMITFNQEMIPTNLLLSIMSSRMSVPLPTILEALLMLFMFEILREAGARIPSYIGQAVSVAGALILGQAAVDARIVSAPMVIMVALTGITSLVNIRMGAALIVMRAFLLFLASLLGMYGYFFGLIGVLIHLMSLRSFGVPYMMGTGSISNQEIKDFVIRTPWWDMHLRPAFISHKNRHRIGSVPGGKGKGK